MSQTSSRADIARSAASSLREAGPDGLREKKAFVGFDGFIDSMIHPVSRRHSMRMDDFDRIPTIAAFADRCALAAGKSTNIELFVNEVRFGGNGPLFAGAMARIGMGATYVGAISDEGDESQVHPVFQPFAERCERCIPIGPPATTEALEFDDGKLMLGKGTNVQKVTWDLLVDRFGVDGIRAFVEEAHVIGVVNWVQMGGVDGIWDGLTEHVLPGLSGDRDRRIFIDIADPAKRKDEDVLGALRRMTAMSVHVPVTLGLNQAEAERLARVLKIDLYEGPGNQSVSSALRHAAEQIRQSLSLGTVVVHNRFGASAADAEHSAWFDGPFTAKPRLSTGAGDHFNGGFASAHALGMPLDQCLAVACATSGAYVRDALSPDLERLAGFLEDLPLPDQE